MGLFREKFLKTIGKCVLVCDVISAHILNARFMSSQLTVHFGFLWVLTFSLRAAWSYLFYWNVWTCDIHFYFVIIQFILLFLLLLLFHQLNQVLPHSILFKHDFIWCVSLPWNIDGRDIHCIHCWLWCKFQIMLIHIYSIFNQLLYFISNILHHNINENPNSYIILN